MKKMRKSTVVAMLTLAMVMSLNSCGTEKKTSTSNKQVETSAPEPTTAWEAYAANEKYETYTEEFTFNGHSISENFGLLCIDQENEDTEVEPPSLFIDDVELATALSEQSENFKAEVTYRIAEPDGPCMQYIIDSEIASYSEYIDEVAEDEEYTLTKTDEDGNEVEAKDGEKPSEEDIVEGKESIKKEIIEQYSNSKIYIPLSIKYIKNSTGEIFENLTAKEVNELLS